MRDSARQALNPTFRKERDRAVANSNLIWVLQKQYEEVNTTFRTSWDLYIKFYTVFLTFDIAAMAFLFGEPGKIQHLLGHKRLIVGVFLLQTLLTAITSGFMAVFSDDSRRLLEEAREALLQQDSPTRPDIPGISLPTALAKWAGWANCGAMVTMAILWLILAW
ncbi:MAG TPA: hypothetical protein VHQ90_00040 [Thermoanaerobaculia bacterium]|nr:hypothetical protein [Thermoanaerobaculia bacterium]